MLTDLTPDGIDALLRASGAGSGSALLSLEIRHMGGAISRAAQGQRLHGVAGRWLRRLRRRHRAGAAGGRRRSRPSLDATLGALEPWEGSRQLLGWRESKTAPEKLYGASLGRLRAIKAEVDPDNLFQANHSC